jgi:hypothetical protein
VIVKGVRYVREGQHEPADLPFVEGEVIDDEGAEPTDRDLTDGQDGAGPGARDVTRRRAIMAAARAALDEEDDGENEEDDQG